MRLLALSALLATGVIAYAAQAQATSGSTPPVSTPAPALSEPSPPSASPTPAPPPAPNAATTPSSPAPSTQPTVANPAPPVAPASPTRQMTVDALEDKDLMGANSGEVGDIESVVENNTDKKRFIVISRGGFLGFFQTDVAIPLENVAFRNDQVILQGLTEEQLKALPKFENASNTYRELGDNENVSLVEVK